MNFNDYNIQKLLRWFIAILFLSETLTLNAQWNNFSFSGSYRLRAEVMNEYNIKTYNTGNQEDFVISRLRADFGLKFYDNLNLHLQVQDSRALGFSIPNSELQGNNPVRDYLDINQLNLTYSFYCFTIKLGRQQIAFRDSRVFGPGNWGNTGRYVWDAIILSYNDKYFESNFITGRSVLHDPERWPNKMSDGPTAYALYNKIKSLPFDLDFFCILKKDNRVLTQGESGIGKLSSHSIGFWLNGNYENFEFTGMTAYQFGDFGKDKINSNALFLSLGYNLNTAWSPEIQVQYTFGSGDKDPNDGINNTFDGIFGGADSKLYGWMNLFFWKNINEYRVNVSVSPIENFTIRSEYHYLTLSESKDAWYFPSRPVRRDLTGNSGVELGHEFDFILITKIFSYLELQTGYCFFIPGGFVKSTGNSPFANWYFLETTIYF